MRKAAAFVLIFLLVLCVSGCALPGPQAAPPDFTEQPVVAGDSHSDVDAVSLQAGGIYLSPEKTVLLIVWNNQSASTLTYGADCWLEYPNAGRWIGIPLTLESADVAGDTLAPGKLVNKTYRIPEGFDWAVSDIYRFRSSCTADAAEGALWAEFTVSIR